MFWRKVLCYFYFFINFSCFALPQKRHNDYVNSGTADSATRKPIHCPICKDPCHDGERRENTACPVIHFAHLFHTASQHGKLHDRERRKYTQGAKRDTHSHSKNSIHALLYPHLGHLTPRNHLANPLPPLPQNCLLQNLQILKIPPHNRQIPPPQRRSRLPRRRHRHKQFLPFLDRMGGGSGDWEDPVKEGTSPAEMRYLSVSFGIPFFGGMA